MIDRAGTVRFAPGKRGAARLDASMHASRAKPGCLQDSFALDVKHDQRIRMLECFVDDLSHQAHRSSPHLAAWRAAWSEAGKGDGAMMRCAVAERAPT